MYRKYTIIFFLIIITINYSASIIGATVNYDNVKLNRAEIELKQEELISVGILIFDPNVPEGESTKTLVFPDIRKAEARYFPYHLKNTLEESGYWGGIWVLPDTTKSTDLVISGRIDKSDGYDVTMRIGAWDISGKQWIDKSYSARIARSSYSKTRDLTQDPYQSVFNQIANDLLEIKNKLSSTYLKRVNEIGDLRFASELLPGVYNDYLLKEEKTGIFEPIRLPSSEDQMMIRIKEVKERELLLLDTLNEYYAQLYQELSVPYEEWRRSNRQNAISYEDLKRSAKKRQILGAVALIGGLMVDSDSNTGRYAQQGLMMGAMQAIQTGFAKASEAKIYKNSMEEGASVLNSTAEGLVIEVEGQTLRLTGNAQEMFSGWKQLLAQIYSEETGLDIPKASSE
tara:strand:- start:85 stop:1281 length:1197 start_codon:yes stop_codon:yes gene_type:complete